MSKKLLKDVRASDLEKTCDFYVRDKPGENPAAYLKNFLRIARQYGYATQDDSWGELEKELSIVFRRLETYKRYLHSQMFKAVMDGDERPIDEIRDGLLYHGECFWEDLQKMKQFDM